MLKSGGVAAAFLSGAGVFPVKTSRALAVAPPSHREDNVIAKSINSDSGQDSDPLRPVAQPAHRLLLRPFSRASPACGSTPASTSPARDS